MRVAKRVEDLPAYLFVEISRKIAEKRAQGIDVITFGIGDPDLPTPAPILAALHAAADDPANHRYPESEGLPELRRAIGVWMQGRFGLTFDSETEILPLIGAKEGIAHIALCFIEPGGVALVPDPGYPVYEIGTMFAGGESYRLPLSDENDWLPDYSLIPAEVLERSRILWINYPNNPTGATASPEFFAETVAFAKRHDLVVCHDNAYSDVAYDGYVPPAFLQAAGARDVGVEFFSFSKTFNMTGWADRLGGGQSGDGERADAGQVEHRQRHSAGDPAHGDRGAGGRPGPGRAQQRRVAASPRPRRRGAAGARAASAGAEGQPVRVGARARRHDQRRLRDAAARGAGGGRHAGAGLRRLRRGIRAALADHPR